jgi:hypothetical protein
VLYALAKYKVMEFSSSLNWDIIVDSHVHDLQQIVIDDHGLSAGTVPSCNTHAVHSSLNSSL